MNNLRYFVFVIFSIVLTSCISMKQQIKRNHRHTERMFEKISSKYGNAFYINSTYATFSTIWYYSEGSIKILKLAKGKIINKTEENSNTFEILRKVGNVEMYELNNCMELDGDGFGFVVSDSVNRIHRDLPIGIDCLKELELNSIFYRKIVEDIKTYNLWEIYYLN